MGYIEDIDTGMTELQSWLENETQLPNIDPVLLRRFLFTCSGNIEKTKLLIEVNYSMRNKNPNIFLKRDPCDAMSQHMMGIVDLVPLPGLTPNNCKIIIYRLADSDVGKFDFTESVKAFFMLSDCRFAMEDPAGMSEGDIPIFDMAGFSLRHLTRVGLNTLRVFMKCLEEAYPVELRQIHVINNPSFIDKIMLFVKPFINGEAFRLVKFHHSGSETLFEHIPKEMLPEEYGGNAGPIGDIKAKWIKIMQDQRDYLMDERNWKTGIRKAKDSQSSTSCREVFRKLSVD